MYSQFSCDYDDFFVGFLGKKKFITHIYTQRLQSQKISSFCKLRKCKGQHGHHFIMILIAFQANAPSKRRNDAQSKYLQFIGFVGRTIQYLLVFFYFEKRTYKYST